MAKFNNLLEQIKSQRVKAVVGVLQAAKSKSLAKWKEMVSYYHLKTSTKPPQDFLFGAILGCQDNRRGQ